MKYTIKGATIIAPSSPHHGKTLNIVISKGKIESIGKESEGEIVEAKGMMLTPGWFDMRAHFNDPGLEYKEDLTSGLEAAASGGFTGVALLPNTQPVIDSKNDINYLRSQNGKYVTDVYPYGAVTKGCEGEELTEMIDLTHAGAVAFTDGINPIWNTDIALKTLQYLQPLKKVLINKAEDKYLNAFGQMHEGKMSTLLGMKGMPSVAEEIMVRRDLDLLNYSGGKIHFSVISSAGSVEMIKMARKKGLDVTCDVAVYQPLLDDGLLNDYDSNLKVSPPLRDKAHNKELIKGLKNGTIDVIVSNHMPQDEESKNLEFDLADYGMISLQSFCSNLVELSASIDWEVLIEKVAINPRNILGLEVPKIEAGAPADLTLFDPEKKWKFNDQTNYSRSENSYYYNKELKGKVVAVFNNGKTYINKL